MKQTFMAKTAFVLILLIGVTVTLYMGIYISHKIWGIEYNATLIQYCIALLEKGTSGHFLWDLLLVALIFYTFSRIAWRVIRQFFLIKKWMSYFHGCRNAHWTQYLSDRYRNWNTEILAVQDDQFVALSIGWLRPRMVISTSVCEMFSEEELEAILLHEFYHCRNHDPLKTFFVTLVSESMGYIPILKELYRHYKIWSELSADYFVIEKMGSSHALGNVLLKLLKVNKHEQRHVGVLFADSAINYRIRQIVDSPSSLCIPFTGVKPAITSIMMGVLMLVGVLDGCA